MRLVFVAVVAFSLGLFVEIPAKLVIRYLYQSEYGRLVYICDDAMRSHYIAKNKVLETPSEPNLAELEIAELALLDCQKYDVLRKKLLTYGLTEHDLSLISLRYIEEKSSDLMDVIEIHEINY
jgi:hypothetical protein